MSVAVEAGARCPSCDRPLACITCGSTRDLVRYVIRDEDPEVGRVRVFTGVECIGCQEQAGAAWRRRQLRLVTS